MLENMEPGGYDVEFVDNEPNDVTCCICLFVLREPMQAEQCGHRFCKSCIDNLKDRKSNTIVCPKDRNTVKVFKDNGKEREIVNTLVKCSNNKYGCTLTRELRDLENHLEVCEFQTIPCPIQGCQDQVQRKFLGSHTKHIHFKYKYTLFENKLEQMKIKSFKLDEQNVNLNRKMAAQNQEIEWQNQKYAVLEKKLEQVLQLMQVKSLNMNKQNEKMLDLNCKIAAQNQKIGLQNEKIRSQNQNIASQNQKFESQSQEIQSQNQKTESQNQTIQSQANEITDLRHTLSELVENSSNQLFYRSYIWKIQNFNKRLERAEADIDCQPLVRRFYTIQGYKMVVKIFLNGDDEEWDEWLTVHIGLEPGKFDETLKWPMAAKISTSITCKGIEDYPRKFEFCTRDKSSRSKFCKPNDDFKGDGFTLIHVYEIEDYVFDNTLTFQIDVSHY